MKMKHSTILITIMTTIFAATIAMAESKGSLPTPPVAPAIENTQKDTKTIPYGRIIKCKVTEISDNKIKAETTEDFIWLKEVIIKKGTKLENSFKSQDKWTINEKQINATCMKENNTIAPKSSDMTIYDFSSTKTWNPDGTAILTPETTFILYVTETLRPDLPPIK